jgi:hypothetical protein
MWMRGNGDAGGPLFVLLVVFLGLPVFFAVVAALLPGYVERSRQVVRAHPGRSGLVGLLSLIVLFGLSYLCFAPNWPPLQALGAVLFFVLVPVGLVLGLLNAARMVGETVWQQLRGRPINPLPAVLLGAEILAVLLLVPFLGWILILILALVGLGGALTALVQRPRPAEVLDRAV